MDIWIKNVVELEKLINDGYTVKIAGSKGKEGWWAIKHIPYKNTTSYRIKDSIIDEMKKSGYKLKETMYSYQLIKG